MAIPFVSYGPLAAPFGAIYGYRFGKNRNKSKIPASEMGIGAGSYYLTNKGVVKAHDVITRNMVDKQTNITKNLNKRLKKGIPIPIVGKTFKTSRQLPNIKLPKLNRSAVNAAGIITAFLASPGVAETALEAHQKLIGKKLQRRKAHRMKYNVQ